MINFENERRYGFSDLVSIMDRLRGQDGCPWDLEQNHQSIRKNFIEEVYEACDAIDHRDDAHLCEELGDVLLQVVFHARIAQDEGAFSIAEVTDGICRKLILRHPHIFGDVSAPTSEQVLKNWDDIKSKEKNLLSYTQAMEDVPKALPALMYAEKIQRRAKKAGFDWDDVSGALQKVQEETQELHAALPDKQRAGEELGDLLFAAVNAARFLDVDPEEALYRSSRKFIRRFARVEQAAEGKLSEMSLDAMDKLWDSVKQQE